MAHNDDRQRLFQPANFSAATHDFKMIAAMDSFCNKAEKLVASKLQKKRLEGVKVVATPWTDFGTKQDVKSSALLYSGKVTIVATFRDGRQTKTATLSVALVDSDLIINDKVLETELKAATSVEAAPSVNTSGSVRASLEDFKVVNDGSKYLKIYHSAAYGDISPIGAVAKNEYAECVNKEALLKDMFTDEAQGWPATVAFKGTFKEPAIVDTISSEAPVYKVKAWETPSPELPAESPLATSYKTFEGTRFALEAHKKTLDDLKDRISQRAMVSLTDSLRSKAAALKLKHVSTEYDLDTRSGKVCLEAEMMDGKDYKMVPLEVFVSGEGMKLPTFEQITALLKSAKIVSKEIQSTSTPAYLTPDVSNPVIKKADGGIGSTVLPPDTLRMNREFLPSTLNVGDIIEVDDDRWELSSKSDDQLSNQKDSDPHWTFKKVRNVPKDDKADFKPRNQ